MTHKSFLARRLDHDTVTVRRELSATMSPPRESSVTAR
jgi:hypothetical protein